jgi:hypothetical protein
LQRQGEVEARPVDRSMAEAGEAIREGVEALRAQAVRLPGAFS